MTEKQKQTPGIRLIPPLVYLVPLLIGLSVEQFLPLVTLSGLWRVGPAKISARLARLSDCGLLHIALLTNPTSGGVTASFAMLGDVILAEPGAFIGFAGPRVIKQTIGQDLPEGFQNSEFQLKHGFVDAVVSRHELKDKLKLILAFATDNEVELESTNGSLEQGDLHQVVDEVVAIKSFEDEAAKN